MGKAALLAIGAFVVMGSIYTMSTNTSLVSTEEQTAEYDYGLLARNAANTGFSRIKQKLADSFVSSSVSGSLEDAGYFTRAVVSSGVANVTSTGTIYDHEGNPMQWVIYAKLQQLSGVPKDPPAFMQYALISEQNITLNGNVLIDTFRVFGSTEATYNANIHTNKSLTVNGKVSVRGFGSYKLSKTINPNNPGRFFNPYYNPTNDAAIKQVPHVNIPLLTMTPATLNAKMAPDTTTGPVTLSGNRDFRPKGATREDPYIWYVDGDLTLNGKITGYAIFLVNGNITLNGQTTIQTGLGPTENTLGLYALGNFTLNGGSSAMWGQMFAKGNFTMNGNPEVFGNVVVGGTATLNGTPDIKYFPASPGLTQYWQDGATSLKLISYVEKDLTEVQN